MKTQFETNEILDFLRKLNAELIGEDMLLGVETNTPPEVTNILEAFSHIRDLGIKHGAMQNKMEMIERLLVFFEIETQKC